MSNRLRLAPNVVVEDLGVDLMVMVSGSSEVVTLSGESARVIRQVQRGEAVSADGTVSELIDRGVLRSGTVSRRGLIKSGAIGAGAGIAVMAMPGVAAASSASLTIFYRTNTPALLIPVSQVAFFSPSAYLSPPSSSDPPVGLAVSGSQEIIDRVTYWVFSNVGLGSILSSDPAKLAGPWIVLDPAPLAPSPITATPLASS